MKIKISITVIFVFVLATSCNISPQPIAYGSDACHYCSMTIVDRQHAAQIVTEKGKVFKFDAPECMLNHLKSVDNSTIALFLVNDYNEPGELIDATTATYLISKGIPSPMGEFLTAFDSRQAAQESEEKHEGEIYSWPKIQERFNGQ